MPSPRCSEWKKYLTHRLKMLVDGLKTYARRKYAQLSLNQYIECNRELDTMTNYLTRNKPSVVYLGDATLPSDSPIGVKKTKRSPGQRRLMVSLKKNGKTDVVLTKEPYTSQTCPNCLNRFPKHTKSHRFKVCYNCTPHPTVEPPDVIVTNASRRLRQAERKMLAKNKPLVTNTAQTDEQLRAEYSQNHRDERLNKRIAVEQQRTTRRRTRRRKLRIAGRRIARKRRKNRRKSNEQKLEEEYKQWPDDEEMGILVYPSYMEVGDITIHKIVKVKDQEQQPRNQMQPRPDTKYGKLGSKKIFFRKTWRSNPRTVVWHRDIAAAKCILYKGMYFCLFFSAFQFQFQFQFVCFRPMHCFWVARTRIIHTTARTSTTINSSKAAKTKNAELNGAHDQDQIRNKTKY